MRLSLRTVRGGGNPGFKAPELPVAGERKEKFAVCVQGACAHEILAGFFMKTEGSRTDKNQEEGWL